jgi:heme oxygenase
LLAHIYIRHFGDLYGGQIIKKAVPGSGKMYEFEDRNGLIAKVRERLSDELGEEANRAIEFNLQLFEEIANEHNIPTT